MWIGHRKEIQLRWPIHIILLFHKIGQNLWLGKLIFAVIVIATTKTTFCAKYSSWVRALFI